ncbi:MAG TPA: TMEM175 family protein [Terriglobales bacterium]|nr:TMEM175 family protein [Terriglobales bacterium]
MTATRDFAPSPTFMRISKHRLDALTDGLFAIVMTLLVLELKVPDLPKNAAAAEIGRALANNLPVFFSFLITFMFAALFWYLHHALLNFMRELPGRFVALNLAFLFFVCLLPFSVGVLGHFLRNPLAQTIYFANQFAISLLLLILWLAAQGSQLIIEPSGREARRFRIRLIALPAATVLAAGCAWLDPRYSFYAIVVVMVGSRIYTARMYGKS